MNFFKNSLLLLIFFCLISPYRTHAQSVEPRSYKLFVNLDKAPFDSLYLHDYTEGRNILIPSRKIKEFTWEITIPDSIISDSENMVLLASPYNHKSNSKQMIRFVLERAGSKIVIANVGVEDENNYIYGTYLDTTVFHNESILTIVNNKDSLVTGDLICADFSLIVKEVNSDIDVRSQDPLFSWFVGTNSDKISYDKHLESYIRISKKYPNSRFLISNLAGNITRYKSKGDITKVYENFSDKHKNTIWARHIEQFLNEKKFQNISLPTFNRLINEKIIQDTSKYNLVVFTASWCVPCIEEIPLLKNIYTDLGNDLILTYVSIDNEKGVVSFKKMIENKSVPWRILFAYQDIKGIKQKYFIEGIPYNILVYPNQDMEIIDIRKNDDRLKLYSLLKSPKEEDRP